MSASFESRLKCITHRHPSLFFWYNSYNGGISLLMGLDIVPVASRKSAISELKSLRRLRDANCEFTGVSLKCSIFTV